jgi:DNA-binding IclR family transcriptional regulator
VLLAYQPAEYQEAYIKSAKLTALTPQTNTDPAVLRRQLEEVRAKGCWLSSGESVAGSAAIAAPVFGPSGQILAALSVGAPSERMEANRELYRRAVTEAARRASGGEA